MRVIKLRNTTKLELNTNTKHNTQAQIQTQNTNTNIDTNTNMQTEGNGRCTLKRIIPISPEIKENKPNRSSNSLKQKHANQIST